MIKQTNNSNVDILTDELSKSTKSITTTVISLVTNNQKKKLTDIANNDPRKKNKKRNIRKDFDDSLNIC
jgi:hypothetical protein